MTDCALLPKGNEVSYDHDCAPSTAMSAGQEVNHNTTDDTPSDCTNTDGLDKQPPVLSENNGGISDAAVEDEPPLRRSRRGRGRGNNGTTGSGGNGNSTDDRVPSCIVGGIEYKTGDFVYYEETDFEYFTIGLIEEVKLSRREKFSVSVKCFYRTQDIPESAKQSVLDREHYQFSASTKAKNEILARELFISDVQDTISSKQLRGRCKVSHMPDLRTALDTFTLEEDTFFYVFAYNPENRRLMNTRAEIRIGQAYQAPIPSFRHCPPAAYRLRPHHRSHSKHAHIHRHHHHHHQKANLPKLEDVRDNELLTTTADGKAPSLRVNGNCTLQQGSNFTPMSEPRNQPTDGKAMEHSPAEPRAEFGGEQNDTSKADDLKTHCKPESVNEDRRSVVSEEIPDLKSDCPHQLPSKKLPHRKRRARCWETIMWRPQGLSNTLTGVNNWKNVDTNDLVGVPGDIADEPLKIYLDAVRSMVAFFGFGGADDDLSSTENGLVLANLAVTTQHAYDTLHKADYSLRQAMENISYNPVVSKDTPRHWTADQVRLFAQALRVHGKDFHAIQRDFFGGHNSVNVNGGGISTGLNASGRSRGRGRRKGLSSASVNSGSRGTSMNADGDMAVKVDECRTDMSNNSLNIISVDDVRPGGKRGASGFSPGEPVKTVKELIAFYYYWKRKGTTASAAFSQSGGLGSAAVNFSAAVAAASAECVSSAVTNSSNEINFNASASQQSGRRRKQAPRGNTSAAAGADEHQECVTERDSDAQSSNTPVADNPASDSSAPASRLRRRLCRNCEKDLASPSEQALPSGVGQLRFLCYDCRIHLQKYGELKSTSSAVPDAIEENQPPKPPTPDMDSTLVACEHSSRGSSWSTDPSILNSPHSSESIHPSPNHRGARRIWCNRSHLPPTCSLRRHSSPSSDTLESDNCLSSSSSVRSDYEFSNSSGSCSPSERSSLPPAKHRAKRAELISVNHSATTTHEHSKRRRYQSYSESLNRSTQKDSESFSRDPSHTVCDVRFHSPPVLMQSYATVDATSFPGRKSSSDPVQVRPGSTPAHKFHSMWDRTHDDRNTPESVTGARSPLGEGGQEAGSDSVDQVALADDPDPTACFVEAHRSTWSCLTRVWDRSVNITIADSNRIVKNSGSCARTDLIYTGRKESESGGAITDSEYMNAKRRELYARYADTAVGPGTTNISAGDGPKDSISHSPTPNSKPSEDTLTENLGQQPSIRTTGQDANSAALDLCSRPTQHSPVPAPSLNTEVPSSFSGAYRSTAPSPSLLRFSSNSHSAHQSSSVAGPPQSPYNPSAPNFRTSLPQPLPSVQTYDPSQTHHHIQTAYEQAMLLAAAASHYRQNQPHSDYPTREQTKQPTASAPSMHFSSRHLPTSSLAAPKSANAGSQAAARLGAAAGTFYPPLVTCPNTSLNLGTTSLASGSNVSQMDNHQLLPHMPLMPPPSTASYPAYSNFPTSSTSCTSAPGFSFESALKNAELMRQLNLMGLLPPSLAEHAMLGQLDPKNSDLMRRMMSEKFAHVRPTSSSHQSATEHHHSQMQQQQHKQHDLLAAAELLMRSRGDQLNPGFPISTNQLYPPPVAGNTGAMTSAVNSISTRPTASVQSPHFRFPPTQIPPPYSSASLPRHALTTPDAHSQFGGAGFHLSPPVAHTGSSSQQPSRTPVTSMPPPPLCAANYLSFLSGIQSPGPSTSGRVPSQSPVISQTGANNPGARASEISPAQLQEQMLNAAKFAMFAANMQSDPNKAIGFANLAAAAFAEMAAQSSQAHPILPQFGGGGGGQSASKNESNVPLFHHFDLRPAGAMHQPHPENMGNLGTPTDRRRSLPLNPFSPPPMSPSIMLSPQALNNNRLMPSVSGSANSRTPLPSSSTSRIPQPPTTSSMNLNPVSLMAGGLTPAQIAQLNQFAQSTGLASGLSLQDPAVLNALALAAAAAYAAAPPQSADCGGSASVGSAGDGESFEKMNFQNQSIAHQRQTSLQQQMANVPFSASGLHPLNLGPRLPSAHR
ncbi:unnamed protein product [Calicophoron daubneyi]|uniref:Arginine-glutamic acid dipeptide repeats protein n=1 Tax=Calicophoron daubneyi TaxID=300641 RepID=A0AAV2SYC6_CALDB